MNDEFEVGNLKIPYKDVKSYEHKYDSNGNPIYTVITDYGKYKITGMQTYAFDPTRVHKRR